PKTARDASGVPLLYRTLPGRNSNGERLDTAYKWQIGVLADELEAVADEDAAMIGLERAIIDIQLDGAQLRTVDERDQLQLRGILLAQLLEQVALDHASGDDVLQEIDVLSPDVRPVQVVDLHRAGDFGVGHFPDDIDVAIADFAWNRAHQVGEKERRPLQHAQQKYFGFSRVLADVSAELRDAPGDLLLAERFL